jgi:uncharacterized surface protein with fasciclin (FAS1) repeats
MSLTKRFAPVATLLVFPALCLASDSVRVGGAAMHPSKNIVQNAAHSEDHTTLVAAVKAAGLVETLQGEGPFTVFAPTNAAFAALPEGTVSKLLKPHNKQTLIKVLTYHVVAGNLDGKRLMTMIHEGDGKACLQTVAGEPLTVKMNGDNLLLEDAKGGIANITIKNVTQSNGVIHVIDRVLLP